MRWRGSLDEEDSWDDPQEDTAPALHVEVLNLPTADRCVHVAIRLAELYLVERITPAEFYRRQDASTVAAVLLSRLMLGEPPTRFADRYGRQMPQRVLEDLISLLTVRIDITIK